MKTCEEYVLNELKESNDKLNLLISINNNLSNTSRLYDELLEKVKAMKLYILNTNYTDYSVRSYVFEDCNFAIIFKDKLIELGITKEEQEEYVKQRLEEAKQEEEQCQ
ncbi:MAG: hypothetical protein RR623_06570 [Bacilli bacterium]